MDVMGKEQNFGSVVTHAKHESRLEGRHKVVFLLANSFKAIIK